MKKPFVIGLTGSLAMGKSQTAGLFAAEGVAVHDADAAIAALYGRGGAAVDKIAASFPGAVRGGEVDRVALSGVVARDPSALRKLETLVHPLVTAERDKFLKDAAARGDEIVLLDIPLLFETGAEAGLDAVVVVSAPPDIQRQRALERPGMTEEKFNALLARQMPDADKRGRADFVVASNWGLDHARGQVKNILAAIREKIQNS